MGFLRFFGIQSCMILLVEEPADFLLAPIPIHYSLYCEFLNYEDLTWLNFLGTQEAIYVSK